MGKYTKKAKMTADVALTDVSLGVRTHAKTLALHRLPSAAALPPSKPDACYLELRSRRLEKTMQPRNSRNTRGCRGGEGAEELSPPYSTRGEGLGIEASFGENNLDFDFRERCGNCKNLLLEACDRGTRESTPCSSSDTTITTPGSTTKQTCPTAVRNAVAKSGTPSPRELEEFFAREEQSMQRHFVEKYNFDIVRDLPVAGRYEWVVAVRP